MYPIIFYICIFIIINNPVIYAESCYFLQCICRPCIKFILYIIESGSDYTILYVYTDIENILSARDIKNYMIPHIETYENKLHLAAIKFEEITLSINNWYIYKKIDMIVMLKSISTSYGHSSDKLIVIYDIIILLYSYISSTIINITQYI